MEITVEHLGAVQFEIRARQHTIMSDQPEANGGFDEAMMPPELMLASLGRPKCHQLQVEARRPTTLRIFDLRMTYVDGDLTVSGQVPVRADSTACAKKNWNGGIGADPQHQGPSGWKIAGFDADAEA